MNKSVLFLICLIAPIAFAQQDILNMLDKSPEGKQVLDNLFVQTKLMGDSLDIATLKNFLKSNRDAVSAEQETLATWKKAKEAECEGDKKAIADLLHDHHEREFALRRQLESASRAGKRIRTFLERAQEELENYKKFEVYIIDNKKAWNDYFSTASTNFKTVSEVLKQVADAGKSLTPAAGTSFIQLPSNYLTNLAEIKLSVESIDTEFTGMGPILSNLMEIMADPSANTKPEVHNALRGLARTLIESVRERVEELEDENEHQKALFEYLEKAFHENVTRSETEVSRLKKAVKRVDGRADSLSKSTEHAKNLASKVENIFTLRKNECHGLQYANSEHAIRSEKISSVITQVEEIVINKSNGLKSFFLQREMRKN